MNLLETYVTNITNIGKPDKYGFCEVTADFDCYGVEEVQKTKKIHLDDIYKIKRDGFYLC